MNKENSDKRPKDWSESDDDILAAKKTDKRKKSTEKKLSVSEKPDKKATEKKPRKTTTKKHEGKHVEVVEVVEKVTPVTVTRDDQVPIPVQVETKRVQKQAETRPVSVQKQVSVQQNIVSIQEVPVQKKEESKQLENLIKKVTALEKKNAHLLTRYSSIQAAYQELNTVGVKDAENTFKQLQSASTLRYDAYEKMIASLQSEIAATHDRYRVTQTENIQLTQALGQLKLETRIHLENEERMAHYKQEILSYEDLCRGLKQELAMSQDRLSNIQQDNETLAAQLMAQTKSKSDEKYIWTLERHLQFYEDLTGIRVSNMEKTLMNVMHDSGTESTLPAISFTCSHKGRHQELQYQLILPTSEGSDYMYKPISTGDYPDFLASEIEFEPKMMQLFFWKVTDFLQRLEK